MGLDGVLGNRQPLADLPAGQAVADQCEDLCLPRRHRQAVRGVPGSGRRDGPDGAEQFIQFLPQRLEGLVLADHGLKGLVEPRGADEVAGVARDHDHPSGRVGLEERTGHLEPLAIDQRQVEHQHVGAMLKTGSLAFGDAPRLSHHPDPAADADHATEQLEKHRLIFDDHATERLAIAWPTAVSIRGPLLLRFRRSLLHDGYLIPPGKTAFVQDA